MRLVIGFALLVAFVLSACDGSTPLATAPSTTSVGGSPPGPTAVRVAFVQDLAPEPALGRTLPAFHAADLAFTMDAADADAPTTVELVAFDVEGDLDTAREIAAEITDDPSYIAAIAAPGLTDQQALADAMPGVPLLSLSSRDSVRRESGSWVRFVAPLRDQAVDLARLAESLRASRRGVCLAPAQSQRDPFARYTRRALSGDIAVDITSSAAQVATAGCGTVVWTGNGADAAALAFDLRDDVRLIGGPGLRDPDFLEEAGSAAEGAMAICSCADVSTSLDLDARRFIQTFQAEFGTAPGAFSLEAWDAAHLLLAGMDAAGVSRTGLSSWIAAVSRFEGLASTYGWANGELIQSRTFIRTYRVVGGRWVPADGEPQA